MAKLNKLGVENSLWNNIRANKGSGKAPTKEMLKQERKINAKYPDGGTINNPGFNALPQNVQQKILANMAMGGPVLGENMYGMGGYLPKHVLGKTVGALAIKYPAMNTAAAESSRYNKNVMPVVGGHTMSPEEVAAARQQKIYGSMVAQNQNDAYRKNYDANKTQAFNQPTMRAEGTARTPTPMATAFAKNAHTGWKERLAAETAATGDKLRVSNMPNTFDDYFNVPSIVGGMASHIGQAPLQSQQTHSAMPYITAIGEPLAAGALSAAIHPMVHKMHVPTTGLVEGAVAGNLVGNTAKLGINQLVKRGVTAAEHQGLTAVKGQIAGGGAHHAHGGMVHPKYRYSNGRFLPMHNPGGSVGGETVVGTPPATRFQKMGGMNMVGAVANPLIDMASDSGNEKYLSDGERNVQGGLNTVADVAIASGNPYAIAGGLAVKGGVALYNGLDLGGSAAEGRAKEKTYNTNVQNTKNIYGVGDQSITRQSYNNNNAYAYGGMTVINRDHPNPQEEVEGGESAMLPNGKNVQFNGPKHTNGGIKTSLPEGTRIFSDQLIYPGKR